MYAIDFIRLALALFFVFNSSALVSSYSPPSSIHL